MATHDPSDQVKWLHDRSRFTLSGGSAGSEFPAEFGSEESTTWVEGCAAWGAVFAIIGLVMSLVIAFGYLFSLCCSCKPCSRKKKDEDNRGKLSHSAARGEKKVVWSYNRRLYAITLISIVVFLILALSSFYPVTSFFDDGVNRALDGIESAQQTLQRLINIAVDLKQSLTTIDSKTREAAREAEEEGLSSVESDLRDFASDVNTTKSFAEDGISAARNLDDSLGDVVSDGRDASDAYAKKIAFSYVAILCVSTVVFLITLIPKKLCSLPYKIIGVPLNTLFLLLLWTFTGVYLVIGMMSADYCIKPNQNTVEIFEASVGSNSESTQSVRYYLSCDPTSPEGNITDSDGLRYDVRKTVGETRKLETTFEKIADDIQGQGGGDVYETFRSVNTTLQEALDTVQKLDDVASCKTIRRTWDIFIEAFCEHFISDGIITLFGIQTFMSVLLLFIMISGWSFCIRHPSRKFEDEDKKSLSTDDPGQGAEYTKNPIPVGSSDKGDQAKE